LAERNKLDEVELLARSVSGLPDMRRRADWAKPKRNKLDEVEFL